MISGQISDRLNSFSIRLTQDPPHEIHSGNYAHFDWFIPNFSLNSNSSITTGTNSRGFYYDEEIATELLFNQQYRENFIRITTEYFRQVNLYSEGGEARYDFIQNYLVRFTKIIQGYRILMTLCQYHRENREIAEFEKQLAQIYQTVYKKSRQDPNNYRLNVDSGDDIPKSIEQCFESDISAMVFYDQYVKHSMQKRSLATLVFPENKAHLTYFQIERTVNNHAYSEKRIIYPDCPSLSPSAIRYFVKFAKPQQGFYHPYTIAIQGDAREMNCSVTRNYLIDSINADKNLINETLANILSQVMLDHRLKKNEVLEAVKLARLYGGLRNLDKNGDEFKIQLDAYLLAEGYNQEAIKRFQRFSAGFQKLSEQAGIYSGRIVNARKVGLRLAFLNDDALEIFNAKNSDNIYCQIHVREKVEIQIKKNRQLTGGASR